MNQEDDQVKALCYAGVPAEESASILNLPVDTIESQYKLIEADIQNDRAAFFDTVSNMSISIVRKNLWKLKKFADDPDSMPIPIDDLNKLTSIFTAIDKVARLERGEATSIVRHVGLTPDEAMKVIEADYSCGDDNG